MAEPSQEEALQALLEHDLFEKHGPMMGGESLRIALGYPSRDAFRQAVVRKTIPIPLFAIEKRRGKFALTREVAAWLAAQRIGGMVSPSTRAQGNEGRG